MARTQKVLQEILSYIQLLDSSAKILQIKQSVFAVHRMRTSARRLRNSLILFADVLPEKEVYLRDRQLKKMARALGETRDMDVQIDVLQSFRKQNSLDGLNALIKIFQEKRKVQSKESLNALNRLRHQQTIQHLKKIFIELEMDDSDLEKMASQVVAAQSKNLLNFEPYVNQPTKSKELHQMRIAAKHLRYTLETLKFLYGVKIEAYIKEVLAIHRILGDLHDDDVWIESLPTYLSKDKVLNKTIQYLLRKFKTRRSQAYKKFVSIWQRLKREELWSKLNGSMKIIPNVK